jgi:sugar/nucleoside kinase (ribokinase family)
MSVVTIGEVVVDWISTEVGTDFTDAKDFVRSLGGNASNVAIGLARLGVEVRLIGKRGDDPHGKYLDSVLQNERVNLNDLIVDQGSPTAQCYVFRHEREEYSFFNWPRPNASHLLTEDEVTENSLVDATFLHATGISLTIAPRRHAVIRALKMAKKLGVPISFDAGFPTGEDREAREFALTALKTADIVKVNLSELEFWTDALEKENLAEARDEKKAGRTAGVLPNKPLSSTIVDPLDQSTKKASDEVIEMGKKLSGFLSVSDNGEVSGPNLIVTLGAFGSLLLTRNGDDVFAPALPADSVSELGAGDAFVAGMIAELLNCAGESKETEPGYLYKLKKDQWHRVLTVANAVGALSTRSMTAWEALPTREELSALVKTVV